MNAISRFVAYCIGRFKLSPAVGRSLEIGAYSVLAAVLAYAADSLTAGTIPALNTMASVALTALLAYAGKAARDGAKEAANAAK